jgi:mRNA interferase MazF
MVSGVQKAFPACVRSVKRGDVYYADFGSVEDAVGHELAKKRPVLIIQNNLGNKKSTTTICLCLSTKCKYGLPYHVHFNDLNIVNRESDICAEQIKTIDQCRLEQYLGNVGSAVMEQVDRALLISLGIKGTEIDSNVEVEEHEVTPEPQETLSIFQSMGQQLRFWQDIEVKVSLIKNEISRLDDEINSVLNYIEETSYNAAQGYKVYKVLRDKQVERKALVKEVACLESLIAHVNTEQLVKAFQESIKMSDEKIREANKITFVKELMEEAI